MAKKADVTYQIDGQEYDTYAIACAEAVSQSADTGEDRAIERIVHTEAAARRLFGNPGVVRFHEIPRGSVFNYIVVSARQDTDGLEE